MRYFVRSIVIAAFLIGGLQNCVECQSTNETFRSLLNQYEASIDKADTLLGAKIWSKSEEVSFISPMGVQFGWNGVKNIYRMFANVFADRNLQGSNLKVTVYGDVAWLTFDWVFDASNKASGQKNQSKGRETQIWHKEDGEWKLVHVHYSSLPNAG